MLQTYYPHEYTNKMPYLEPINKRLKELQKKLDLE